MKEENILVFNDDEYGLLKINIKDIQDKFTSSKFKKEFDINCLDFNTDESIQLKISTKFKYDDINFQLEDTLKHIELEKQHEEELKQQEENKEKELEKQHEAEMEKQYQEDIKKESEIIEEDPKLIELISAKYNQKRLIKLNYIQYTRMFQTFNDIIMDGNVQDAENLLQGILFKESQNKNEITIYDHYNADHIVSLEIAKQMVNEIKTNFYNALSLKQNLYTKIDNAKNVEAVKKIRFKVK